MSLEPNPLAMKSGDTVNQRKDERHVNDCGKELSAAVERFLRAASKAPSAAADSGIIWAELCLRLNEALISYRKSLAVNQRIVSSNLTLHPIR